MLVLDKLPTCSTRCFKFLFILFRSLMFLLQIIQSFHNFSRFKEQDPSTCLLRNFWFLLISWCINRELEAQGRIAGRWEKRFISIFYLPQCPYQISFSRLHPRLKTRPNSSSSSFSFSFSSSFSTSLYLNLRLSGFPFLFGFFCFDHEQVTLIS